jgi:hypothetical protein
MKIDSNPIGNYRPVYLQNSVQNNNSVTNAKKSQVSAAAARTVNDSSATITTEEKKYFSDMYPASKQEIADYHFYSRTGKMSGVSVGSLFDRRG